MDFCAYCCQFLSAEAFDTRNINRAWFDTRNTSFCICDKSMSLSDYILRAGSKSHNALLIKGILSSSVSSDENGEYYVYVGNDGRQIVQQSIAEIEALEPHDGTRKEFQ